MQDTVVSVCVVCTRKTNFSPTCCTLLSQESIQAQKCRFIIKMFLMLPNNSDFLVVIILPCPEIKNYWVMSVLCFSHFIKLCVNSVSLFLLVDILFNFISNNL